MIRSRSRAAAAPTLRLCGDFGRFVSAAVRSHAHPAAENLFPKKPLALYVEHQVKPRRADDATRIAMIVVSWLGRLASNPHDHAAGHAASLASQASGSGDGNRGRPHASPGPCIPDGASVPSPLQRHRMPDGHGVVAKRFPAVSITSIVSSESPCDAVRGLTPVIAEHSGS
jgi:hypothetical protein